MSALSDFNLRPTDTFKVTGSNGIISIYKRKEDGCIESLRVRASGSFKQATQFEPSQISIEERRNLEEGMRKSGLSQAEIADLLGVSQATVSLDLRKIKGNRTRKL
jgi:transcriptional antiterminator